LHARETLVKVFDDAPFLGYLIEHFYGIMASNCIYLRNTRLTENECKIFPWMDHIRQLPHHEGVARSRLFAELYKLVIGFCSKRHLVHRLLNIILPSDVVAASSSCDVQFFIFLSHGKFA
jgi:hypothetical protein